jgi:hypothetical protein
MQLFKAPILLSLPSIFLALSIHFYPSHGDIAYENLVLSALYYPLISIFFLMMWLLYRLLRCESKKKEFLFFSVSLMSNLSINLPCLSFSAYHLAGLIG